MAKIGVIGTGDLAHVHMIGLLTSSHYEIAGCYSPESRKSMVFARQYRLVSYSSVDALLKFADAVDITDNLTETMALAELSLKALKHVFVAQPDQLTMEQMQYLRKLAEESGVILQLGTGYRYCPVCNKMSEAALPAMVVDIRHQLINSSDLYSLLRMKLTYNFDFVTSILNTSIRNLQVKSWAKSEVSPDVLHCRLECDNGSTINMLAYTVVEGEPKLEITFTSTDVVIRADIFKSVIERQYRTCNTFDSIELDAYSEKTVQQCYLKNFHRAICNDLDAIRNIDKQFQNTAAADYIMERMK